MAESGDFLMGSQPESNNYTGDDFETVGYGEEPIPEQDEEVTSTSIAGEEKAEEDLYAAGVSDADAVSPSDPLISFGDESEFRASDPIDQEPLLNFSSPPFGSDMSSSPPSATSGRKTPEAIRPPSEPFDSPQTQARSESEPREEPKAEGSWMKNIDPRAKSPEPDFSLFLALIYWRDVRKTGGVFASMLLVLLSLAFFSVLSVVAYLSLAVLTVTLSFRIYRNVMMAVQKTGDGHPFKSILEMDIELSEERVRPVVSTVLQHVNCSAKEVRRLFLVEDLIDSIKFGILLWLLTYLGSWFNGMTLIILAVVGVFTLPKVYETYQVQIDNYVGMAKTQINNVITQVQAKLPFLTRKKAKVQ